MNLNLNSSQTIKTDKKIDQELRKELNEADIQPPSKRMTDIKETELEGLGS